MGILNIKLLRNIWQTKGQFLSLAAVVMVGISIYIAMSSTFYGLNKAKEEFYHDTNFADYYFHVIRAPEQVTRRIAALPGVEAATGRIQEDDVPIIKTNNRKVTARVISYPLPISDNVNRLHLLSGKMFSPNPSSGAAEVLVDPGYAEANNLVPGSSITIVADGREISLTVVGTATSPEFLYPIKDPADLTPDPDSFGIIMMPQNQAEKIFNLAGQVNQVVITFSPGADPEMVTAEVEEILQPYAYLAGYSQSQQLSAAIMQGELDQLRSQTVMLPVIFLTIAAGIQFVMIGRIIRAQKSHIGIMKALGYGNNQVVLHYCSYSLAIALVGASMGTLLGIYFASIFSALYSQYFNLPNAVEYLSIATIVKGFLLSVGTGLISGIMASGQAARISPAEAMHSHPQIRGHRFFLESWSALWQRLTPLRKISLRSISRNRSRFTVTVLGTGIAIGLLVVSLFFSDAFNYLIKRAFFEEQRYDIIVRFSSPVRESEVLSIAGLDGVITMEPVFELPVKISYQGKSEDGMIEGYPRSLTLKNIYDDEDHRLGIPAQGFLLSRRAADKLGVKTGDQVNIETTLGMGPPRSARLTVVGISQQSLGDSSFASLDTVNRILQENRLVTGVMLKVDPGLSEAIESKLNDIPRVSSVLNRDKALDSFNQNLAAMYATIFILVSFALVLGFAIVYNSSVINLSERNREMGTLRAMGLSVKEIAGLMRNENLVQIIIALVIGLPLGYGMARGLATAVSTDLYTLPAIVYPMTYVYAAAGGAFFVVLAYLAAVRGISRIDLVEVMKNQD